eukprot:364320-Amorphochlora_amoeboformis.AAC.1
MGYKRETYSHASARLTYTRITTTLSLETSLKLRARIRVRDESELSDYRITLRGIFWGSHQPFILHQSFT